MKEGQYIRKPNYRFTGLEEHAYTLGYERDAIQDETKGFKCKIYLPALCARGYEVHSMCCTQEIL